MQHIPGLSSSFMASVSPGWGTALVGEKTKRIFDQKDAVNKAAESFEKANLSDSISSIWSDLGYSIDIEDEKKGVITNFLDSEVFHGNSNPRELAYNMIAQTIMLLRKENDWSELPSTVLGGDLWMADLLRVNYADMQGTGLQRYVPDAVNNPANANIEFTHEDFQVVRMALVFAGHGFEFKRDNRGRFDFGYEENIRSTVMRTVSNELDTIRKYGVVIQNQKHKVVDPNICGYFNNPAYPASLALYTVGTFDGATKEEIVKYIKQMLMDLDQKAYDNSAAQKAGFSVPATLVMPRVTYARMTKKEEFAQGIYHSIESEIATDFPLLKIMYRSEHDDSGFGGLGKFHLMLDRSRAVAGMPSSWWFDTCPLKVSFTRKIFEVLYEKQIMAMAGHFIDPICHIIRHGDVS